MTGHASEPSPLFQLEQCQAVNPFIVTYLAVSRGFASDLERCLADAIRDVTSNDENDSRWESDDSLIESSEFLEMISPADGYASLTLRRYLEAAAQLSPEHFGYSDAPHMQALVLSMIEESSATPKAETYATHFISNWRISAAYEKRLLLLLYPFLPRLFPDVPDSETAAVLHTTVSPTIRAKGICSAAELAARIYRSCGSPWNAYANFLALNDPTVVTLRSGERQIYARATHVFPHFELCSAGISPRDYLTTSGLSYRHRTSVDKVTLSVKPERIIAFFKHWHELPQAYDVDWLEIAVKLRLLRLSARPLVQGLDSVLYRALVGCLEHEHIALRLADFRRILGVDDIPLNPFDVPPGRLLAYAPSTRFYRKETAFYVLRDWVEDDDHRKRRIAKDRIVTPLQPRRLFVEPTVVEASIKRNDLYSNFGCIFADAVIDDIARELLGPDIAGYYRRQISRVVVGALRRRFRHLGRGIFVDSRWDRLLADQSTKSMTLRLLRRILNRYRAERNLDSERFRGELEHIGVGG